MLQPELRLSRWNMRAARRSGAPASFVRTLSRLGKELQEPRISDIGERIGAWLDRINDVRRLFSPLLEQDDREEIEALRAASVVEQVVEHVQPLMPGVRFSQSIPSDIYLPAATFAEWNSLFQNVFINAANATIDRNKRRVRCIGGRTGRAAWVRVEDNGSGVEWDRSYDLFDPFTRRATISEERRALGLGGIGLGLTIVRMVAHQRRAKVSFVEASPGWATAFQISWSSAK